MGSEYIVRMKIRGYGMQVEACKRGGSLASIFICVCLFVYRSSALFDSMFACDCRVCAPQTGDGDGDGDGEGDAKLASGDGDAVIHGAGTVFSSTRGEVTTPWWVWPC